MSRTFAATLLAQSTTLASLGVVVQDVEGWFGGGSRILTRIGISGRAGQLTTRMAEDGKQVTVVATLVGRSAADRMAKTDRLLATLGGLPIRLERVDGLGRTTGTGHITGSVDVRPARPRLTSRVASVRFTVALDSAYLSDAAPLAYGFGAARQAMPLGTAPVAPLLRIMGAVTNPVLTLRNVAGEVLSQVTFTYDVPATDYLEIDCSTYRVETVVSGARSDAYSIYAGNADNLPVLDPDDGRQVDGAYPSLELSGGSGLAIYARLWR